MRMKIYVYLQYQLVLIVPSKFFDLSEEGKDFYMFAPHTVKEEYGVTLDHIDLENIMMTWLQTQMLRKRKRMRVNR